MVNFVMISYALCIQSTTTIFQKMLKSIVTVERKLRHFDETNFLIHPYNLTPYTWEVQHIAT